MRPFWPRFLRHAIVSAIALAVVGYILGRAFLIAHRIYAGGAYNPENERVLWQTPVVMATIGVLMTGFLDLLSTVFRKRAVVSAAAPESPPPNA